MQLSSFLLTLISAASLAFAAPAATTTAKAAAATTTVESDSYKAWKDHRSPLVVGKTYVFQALTPLTEAALIDGDKDLQDARNGIGGDHVYLVTVAITSSESGPKNKRVVTLKADARYWDMYVKTGTSTVQTHDFTTWDTKYASDKKVTYQFKKELKTTTAKINAASKDYKAAHGTYDAKTNNCQTYVNALLAAA